MSLDNIARKIHIKILFKFIQIFIKNMSQVLLLKKILLLQFGPQAFLRRAAQPVARGPSRPGQRGRRAQAATWAWAGNPASALAPPGPI
jgi:hypothetical protein